MCGIAGILSGSAAPPVERAVLRAMTDALVHRGPDDSGLHFEPAVGLGHRRLSIIDLGGGHQPLYNEDGRVAVVFNGEIYNFAELRERLSGLGHRFATDSDTEVIVHGWEEWGERCVERLRGMFAFALWDAGQQVLFAARDHLGIKPFHYGWTRDGAFIFGSELKALCAHPGLDRVLDPEALECYFAFGFVPDPRTVLAGVHKLPPGHSLRVHANNPAAPHIRQYWDIPFGQQMPPDDPETLATALRERLGEAVASQLVADVPIGAFLSGGTDSSAVVAFMARAMDRPATTCSIGFDQAEFDETTYAALVAERYGTLHFVDQVSADDSSLLATLASAYDEPFADSSAIPTWRLCEHTRKRVKVALSGDGGDELFAGYEWYGPHVRNAHLRRWLGGPGRSLMRLADHALPTEHALTGRGRIRRLAHKLALDTVDSFALAAMLTSRAQREALYTSDFRRALGGFDAVEVLRDHARNAPSTHPLSLAQYLDMKVYLPGDILTKVDRASMAHALEVRVPMLDHRFVEWAAQLPPTLHLRGGQAKAFFKKSLEPLLPNDVLYRPKRGFSVPLAQWFRGPLAEQARALADDSRLVADGIIDAATVRTLAQEHVRGVRDHAALLWSLSMADASLERLLATAPDPQRRSATVV